MHMCCLDLFRVYLPEAGTKCKHCSCLEPQHYYQGRQGRRQAGLACSCMSLAHMGWCPLTTVQVRDVGTVFLGDEFESLQELCLDNNLLVDVSGKNFGSNGLPIHDTAYVWC